MPNHVMNILKMKGITALPLFGEIAEGESAPAFDFNRIIPMPESLDIESGSVEDIAVEAVIRKIAAGRCGLGQPKAVPAMDDTEYRKRLAVQGRTEDELCRMGLRYISNKVLYGAYTWYDWRMDHWGTKWNAYANGRPDSDTIVFQTAWGDPGPVIARLAGMYPEAEIEHWWADEDTGCGAGHAMYASGKASEIVLYADGSHEAYAAYVRCWGESPCLYQDENGKWRRRDCGECHGCD